MVYESAGFRVAVGKAAYLKSEIRATGSDGSRVASVVWADSGGVR